ncbi:hypothetical protein BCR34DRAFT_667877 [Clohesyomyces aquaticus]|uniref:AA1-like domain-containing protein n=1 Tax=Clohesyomyces aquaticus TaxID=1231657 RepID=A0A1Y1YUM5_9PLEO|nr:hypothetical protein BCR34DRAFT_667877 [Clohesyomyces aquaticus]
MHFSTLLLTLSATVATSTPLAPRATTEFVSMNLGLFSQTDSGLERIAFTLQTPSGDFHCDGENPRAGSDRPYGCQNADYSWRLMSEGPYGWGPYTITVFHQLGTAVGLSGNMTVGCSGPMPKVCSQVGFHNTTLCSDLTVCGAGANN